MRPSHASPRLFRSSFLHSGWVLVSSVEIANDVLGAAAGKRAVYDAVAGMVGWVYVRMLCTSEGEREQEVYHNKSDDFWT